MVFGRFRSSDRWTSWELPSNSTFLLSQDWTSRQSAVLDSERVYRYLIRSAVLLVPANCLGRSLPCRILAIKKNSINGHLSHNLQGTVPIDCKLKRTQVHRLELCKYIMDVCGFSHLTGSKSTKFFSKLLVYVIPMYHLVVLSLDGQTENLF